MSEWNELESDPAGVWEDIMEALESGDPDLAKEIFMQHGGSIDEEITMDMDEFEEVVDDDPCISTQRFLEERFVDLTPELEQKLVEGVDLLGGSEFFRGMGIAVLEDWLSVYCEHSVLVNQSINGLVEMVHTQSGNSVH